MKHQIKIILLSLLTINTLIYSQFLLAHAEKDKSRYISPTGLDSGLCDNPLRPCKTLLYGLSRASKGDKILLAAGSYNIETLDEILALKSTIVPILGGYNRFDHYSNQSPSTNKTTLTGIPLDMLEHVRQQGFTVIADGKAKFSAQRVSDANKQYMATSKSHSAANCVNGFAASFACNNIDLVAHVALSDFSFRPNAGNDIWGHVDLNTNKEYAIMGILNGVAVFDLTNPESPKEIDSISGLNSSWRDVKVYQYFDEDLKIWQAYAYVTIDNASDYVSIIDLNQLPNSVSLVTKDRAVSQAHNVYISNIDYALNIPLNEATPTLQLVGAPRNGSYKQSFLSYSLANPKVLTALTPGDNLTNDYTHDGTSLRIDDARKDTDCGNNGKTCEIFVDFNEQEIKIWNVTTPGQEKELSQIKYTDVAPAHQYVHSGWWSEDKRYIFAHDEFDESRAGINTTLRIFDLQSLTSPTLAGIWTGPTTAIDHNGFVRGNRYYMSNYTRGLTILDITNASTPQEVGFFDTYSASDSSTYSGAWGVYPFLPSGLILVSDINGGMFVLRDNTRTVDQGTVSFSKSQFTTQPDEVVTIEVSRTNGNKDAVTVGWEVLQGSASSTSDYTDTSGTISWADGESDTKLLNITIADNTDINEIKEQFFVRLFNPTNGATLSSPHYTTVNIDGKENPGTVGFEHQTLNINETGGTVLLNVFRNGGSDGNVSVNYALTGNSAVVGEDVQSSSGMLNWIDGDSSPQTIELIVNNDLLLEDDELFTLTLTAIGSTVLSSNPDVELTIKDDDKNTAPAVTIIENFETNTNQTAQLTSNATDAEGDLITFVWSQTSGSNVTIINSTMKDASFVSPPQADTLMFKITATDSRGATTEKTVSVAVKAPVVIDNSQSSSGSIPLGIIISLFMLMVWRQLRHSKS
jgi:choice-of-anchor B domain-containing protein